MGWKTQDMLDGLPPILNLAIASGEQLGTTSDIVTDALTAFGLKAKDAGVFSDVLASASSNANTNVGMMGATFQYAAPVAGALGYSVQDTAIAIGLMANAGIKADKAGTAIRTGLTNLVKPTDSMAIAMDKYGITVKNTNGKMKPFRQLIGELRGKLGKLDKATQANVVSTIFGKEAMSGWLSIINASPQDVDKLTKAIDTSKGATDKMAKTMSNNAKGSITEMKSALEGAGIKIFEVVAPSITNLAKQVSNMADKFSKLSPKTQETIVKMAALGIATGPLIGGIGKTIKGVGNLAGGLSKLTGFLGKTKTATTAVNGATTIATKGISAMGLVTKAGALLLNPWTIGIAAVGVSAYALHKHLSKETVPSVDLFNNKVKTTQTTFDRYGNKIQVATTRTINFANSTKKAVGGFISLNNGAKKQLTNLYVNSTTITDKTAKELTSKYKQMGEQIKAGEDKKYQERLESFKKFLDNNKNMSDKDKKQALESMEKAHLNQQKQTYKYTKQIQDILNKASKEKRALTLDEQKKINEIQEKMKVEGIKKLSKTEEESKVILSRIKSYGSRITAEQASEVIKNAEKQRKESVKNAEQQHSKTVAQIRKMCDEDKSITKDQAEKMIKEADRQKQESIDKANQLKDGVVGKMREQNSEILKDINTSNGEIKTNWDKLKSWFTNNPIVRWIKSKVEEPATTRNVGHNWTGNKFWEGGLTYLHDAPGRNSNYELYDLPRGTRMFNHDASVDLVKQTAENVATKVANSILKGFNGGTNGINVTQNIYAPTPSPSEIARQTKNNLRELSLSF
ncbi:phage tail tape measure protein [Hathewaya limosa]|uniref:TP901 family phage tail tape measure protein n=1 Tax=Hathewaya limosa TaxID=1536 RepID=A0ABU0JRJ4_HATLI|nr:phage tail tape measure protein [Hathewaya limosa]MDQ0479716.1 TP901 family phage tail tape measure protein [Hathewaya limosa]